MAHKTAPAVDYIKAMKLFMIEAQPDKITTVRECPPARFAGLVMHAAQSAKDPASIKEVSIVSFDETQPLDFEQAMNLHMVESDGSVVEVRDIHATQFRMLLQDAAKDHPAYAGIKADFRQLQLRYRHDRWQALRILKANGIELPIAHKRRGAAFGGEETTQSA